MTLDTLKEKKELASTALILVSVLALVLILVKVTGFFVTSAKAEDAVKDAIKHGQPEVRVLKCFRSSGMCHGRSCPFPITRFSAPTAAMITSSGPSFEKPVIQPPAP